MVDGCSWNCVMWLVEEDMGIIYLKFLSLLVMAVGGRCRVKARIYLQQTSFPDMMKYIWDKCICYDGRLKLERVIKVWSWKFWSHFLKAIMVFYIIDHIYSLILLSCTW